jgi:tRNA modification GTPase
MALKGTGWDDTIIALATPPGIGAIGVIRLSGPKSIGIANELFSSKDLLKQASHTLHVGYLKEDGIAIDEAVIGIFKSPRSYTGEDVVEISCHGSPFVQQQVIDACIRKGARVARPGEFTFRAFINGKLDLSQAEAVADLIASNSAASHRTALNNIKGGFSEVLKQLREELIKFSALIELELDFSQEDVEFADRKQLHQLIDVLSLTTKQLLESFRLGNVIRNGVQVAIIGKPNAGKSTLLNTLLNDNRAIVSEIAGTTRDTIEELLNIDGIIFRLVDTAGLREQTTDVIERIGVERSLHKMHQSDVVIYLFDVNEVAPRELKDIEDKLKEQRINYILAGNKSDLLDPAQLNGKFNSDHVLFISAKKQSNINALKKSLVNLVTEGQVNLENTIVTNARHYEALQEVDKSLEDIRAGLNNNLPGDLLALDIRRCLHYLGEITGEITNEDQLDYIFSKFCIGK